LRRLRAEKLPAVGWLLSERDHEINECIITGCLQDGVNWQKPEIQKDRSSRKQNGYRTAVLVVVWIMLQFLIDHDEMNKLSNFMPFCYVCLILSS
jgi:hypothetical protein